MGMSNVGRVVTLLSGLLFAGFGAAFAAFPAAMSAYVGIELPTPTAATDVRAVYGGLEIGFGIFLLACAFSRTWGLAGLAAAALALAGLAAARVGGIVADGSPTPITFSLLAGELSGLAIAGGALLYERRARGEGAGQAAPAASLKPSKTPSSAARHMPDL
jgi:hypothetical protein